MRLQRHVPQGVQAHAVSRSDAEAVITVAITLALSISAYTPGANVISGGAIMADGRAPYIGAYACPRVIPLGWTVTVIGDAADRLQAMRLPATGVCADRMHRRYIRHLDVAIPRGYAGMTDLQRLSLAYRWGRFAGMVVFTP
jgi:hypothetical protein